MLIKWYKYSALTSAALWIALGIITIGSIVLSSIGWGINLIMGLLFMLIGCFLYFRAYNLHHFYVNATENMQENLHLRRFLRLDLIFVLGTLLVGALLVSAATSRVFGEGFPIFG